MPVNLNTNPSIEVDTSGYIDNGAVTMSRDITEYYHGIASLKIITGNVADEEGWKRVVTATTSAGEEYTFSVYLKGSGTVYLRFYDDDTGSQYSDEITLTGTWTRYSLTRTFGAGSTKRMLYVITMIKQTITFYSDAIMHTEGSTLWAYFEGTADWTYTGAITFVGTLQKLPKKLLTGNISFTGTLQKLPKKILTGVITFTGTLQKLPKKLFTGAISFIGTLTSKKLWSKITRAVASFTKTSRDASTFTKDSRDTASWSKEERK